MIPKAQLLVISLSDTSYLNENDMIRLETILPPNNEP